MSGQGAAEFDSKGQGLEGPTDAARQRARGARCHLVHRREQLLDTVRDERPRADERFAQRDAERELIGPRAAAPLELLGSHVRRRASNVPIA